MITDEERNTLLCDLGVYGKWLLEHGKELPKEHTAVVRLMKGYALYYKRPENAAIAIVMNEIDNVICELNWEPLDKKF